MKDFNKHYRNRRNDFFNHPENMPRPFSNNKSKKIVFGVLLTIVGLFIMAHKLGYFSEYFYNIVMSWQMLLVGIGVIQLFSNRKSFGGIILIIIGIIFILPEIVSFPEELRNLTIPAILVIIGILVILKSIFRSPKDVSYQGFDSKKTENSTDYIDESYIFGGTNLNVVSKNFKGGKIEAIFGGGKVNLLDAELSLEGKNVLEVNLVFGGIELIVPRDWNVVIKTNSVLGAFTEKNHVVANAIDPNKELVIIGRTVFGGGEVKRY